MRTGLIVKKLGMSAIFDEEGNRIAVTLLKADESVVVGKREEAKDGYKAVIVGFGEAKKTRVNKAQKVEADKLKINVPVQRAEFRIKDDSAYIESNKALLPSHFVPGQLVDITGVSVGKGFAGAMKRHNFGGLRASHGVSISHRAHGSTGQCQDPGKVFKGKKMAGHMGAEQVTTQNLTVMQVNDETGVIVVRGAVPGHKNALLTIKDSVKKPFAGDLPFPAAVK